MKKPVEFPFPVTRHGRTGEIYRLGNGTFKTHFRFGGTPRQNTFGSFDAAFLFLDKEFSTLDSNQANSRTLYPVSQNLQYYYDLEQRLRTEGNGETLAQAVDFLIARSRHGRFEPKTVSACMAAFLRYQETQGVTKIHGKTLKKHFKGFEKDFGFRLIHEISTQEITDWLASQVDPKAKKQWSVKTRRSVRGSLVSLSIYAQEQLKALPKNEKTEFQLVKNAKPDTKKPVEIYTPTELEKLLLKALETDIELLPGLIVGNFLGLRPYEFHAESLSRPPLTWEEFNWDDKVLHVTGQKVRTKSTRDIPIQPAAEAWLEPFKELTGSMWRYTKAYEDKMNALRRKAGVESLHDGYRHSYCSHRIRQLKQNFDLLAAEMGNSPREIQASYKRNVTDKQADAWFGLMPPADYQKKVAFALEHC